MNEKNNYDSMKAKGVDNYIQTLKKYDLFEAITYRLKKKNRTPPIELIKYIFDDDDIDFCNSLFSDFYFDYDSFFENFISNIKSALQIGFNKHLEKFEISYIFHNRTTKEYLGETKFSEGKDILTKEENQNFNKWMSSSDPIFKIQANVKKQRFEFLWEGYNHCSSFLNEINKFNNINSIEGNWYPLPSDFSENYIFTSKKEYDLIKSNFLIIPENYESENFEYPVQYAGI